MTGRESKADRQEAVKAAPAPATAPIALAVASARSSTCDSASLADLDWSNWWTDTAYGHNYLHVMHKDGQTVHRVRCKVQGCIAPRLTMQAGVLHWLVDSAAHTGRLNGASAPSKAQRDADASIDRPARRRVVSDFQSGPTRSAQELKAGPQWDLLATVLTRNTWTRAQLAEELRISIYTLNKWMETETSKNFRRMGGIYRHRLIELATGSSGN